MKSAKSRKRKLKFKHSQKYREFRNRKSFKRRRKSRLVYRKPIDNVFINKSQKTIMENTNIAYSNAKMVRLVGFKDIYPEIENYPTIESLLESIPRDILIKLTQTLTNLYKNASIKDMQKFFSTKNNSLKEDINNRFDKIANPNIECIFCTIQTTTELLKYAFSLTTISKELSNEKVEENILKAILIINESLTNFKEKKKNPNKKLELAELLLVNSFSQKDINNFDYNVIFRELFTKSIDLFEYISRDEYFKPIYDRFKEKLQISDYKDYIKTILGVFSIMYKNALQTKRDTKFEHWAGKIVYDAEKDKDKLIKTSVLDYISLKFDENYPIDENSDYKIFRNKPIIKFPDGSYEIQNMGFLLERLFYSLYFDFNTIAKELNLSNFDNEYKENFGEKFLLCKYIELANGRKKYTALSSKESKLISQEGGEPDYYLKSKSNSIILFESKDIMINGSIKQSRDFEQIINEYKNKLLLKTHSNGKPVKTPKPEGIGQLVSQIKKIQTGNAFWDKTVSKDSVIYPVLVVADSKLLPDGLTYLMQDWYINNCETENIDKKTARPLIVMSISTLLLYAKEFEGKGYEYYFEKYYESIECTIKGQSKDQFLDIINASISFSDYMEKVHPKNFTDTFNSYKEKLFN